MEPLNSKESQRVQEYQSFIQIKRSLTRSQEQQLFLQTFQFNRDELHGLMKKSRELYETLYNKKVWLNIHTDGKVGHVSIDGPILLDKYRVVQANQIGLDPDPTRLFYEVFSVAKGKIFEQDRSTSKEKLLKTELRVTEEQFFSMAKGMAQYQKNPPTYNVGAVGALNCIEFLDKFLKEHGVIDGLKNKFDWEKYKGLDWNWIKIAAGKYFDEHQEQRAVAFSCTGFGLGAPYVTIDKINTLLKEKREKTQATQLYSDIDAFVQADDAYEIQKRLMHNDSSLQPVDIPHQQSLRQQHDFAALNEITDNLITLNNTAQNNQSGIDAIQNTLAQFDMTEVSLEEKDKAIATVDMVLDETKKAYDLLTSIHDEMSDKTPEPEQENHKTPDKVSKQMIAGRIAQVAMGIANAIAQADQMEAQHEAFEENKKQRIAFIANRCAALNLRINETDLLELQHRSLPTIQSYVSGALEIQGLRSITQSLKTTENFLKQLNVFKERISRLNTSQKQLKGHISTNGVLISRLLSQIQDVHLNNTAMAASSAMTFLGTVAGFSNPIAGMACMAVGGIFSSFGSRSARRKQRRINELQQRANSLVNENEQFLRWYEKDSERKRYYEYVKQQNHEFIRQNPDKVSPYAYLVGMHEQIDTFKAEQQKLGVEISHLQLKKELYEKGLSSYQERNNQHKRLKDLKKKKSGPEGLTADEEKELLALNEVWGMSVLSATANNERLHELNENLENVQEQLNAYAQSYSLQISCLALRNHAQERQLAYEGLSATSTPEEIRKAEERNLLRGVIRTQYEEQQTRYKEEKETLDNVLVLLKEIASGLNLTKVQQPLQLAQQAGTMLWDLSSIIASAERFSVFLASQLCIKDFPSALGLIDKDRIDSLIGELGKIVQHTESEKEAIEQLKNVAAGTLKDFTKLSEKTKSFLLLSFKKEGLLTILSLKSMSDIWADLKTYGMAQLSKEFVLPALSLINGVVSVLRITGVIEQKQDPVLLAMQEMLEKISDMFSKTHNYFSTITSIYFEELHELGLQNIQLLHSLYEGMESTRHALPYLPKINDLEAKADANALSTFDTAMTQELTRLSRKENKYLSANQELQPADISQLLTEFKSSLMHSPQLSNFIQLNEVLSLKNGLSSTHYPLLYLYLLQQEHVGEFQVHPKVLVHSLNMMARLVAHMNLNGLKSNQEELYQFGDLIFNQLSDFKKSYQRIANANGLTLNLDMIRSSSSLVNRHLNSSIKEKIKTQTQVISSDYARYLKKQADDALKPFQHPEKGLFHYKASGFGKYYFSKVFCLEPDLLFNFTSRLSIPVNIDYSMFAYGDPLSCNTGKSLQGLRYQADSICRHADGDDGPVMQIFYWQNNEFSKKSLGENNSWYNRNELPIAKCIDKDFYLGTREWSWWLGPYNDYSKKWDGTTPLHNTHLFELYFFKGDFHYTHHDEGRDYGYYQVSRILIKINNQNIYDSADNYSQLPFIDNPYKINLPLVQDQRTPYKRSTRNKNRAQVEQYESDYNVWLENNINEYLSQVNQLNEKPDNEASFICPANNSRSELPPLIVPNKWLKLIRQLPEMKDIVQNEKAGNGILHFTYDLVKSQDGLRYELLLKSHLYNKPEATSMVKGYAELVLAEFDTLTVESYCRYDEQSQETIPAPAEFLYVAMHGTPAHEQFTAGLAGHLSHQFTEKTFAPAEIAFPGLYSIFQQMTEFKTFVFNSKTYTPERSAELYDAVNSKNPQVLATALQHFSDAEKPQHIYLNEYQRTLLHNKFQTHAHRLITATTSQLLGIEFQASPLQSVMASGDCQQAFNKLCCHYELLCTKVMMETGCDFYKAAELVKTHLNLEHPFTLLKGLYECSSDVIDFFAANHEMIRFEQSLTDDKIPALLSDKQHVQQSIPFLIERMFNSLGVIQTMLDTGSYLQPKTLSLPEPDTKAAEFLLNKISGKATAADKSAGNPFLKNNQEKVRVSRSSMFAQSAIQNSEVHTMEGIGVKL
ncbi:bZIP transcription factor [Legionella shakespearei]|uniref:Uncharacterized protein n=1 Tax=Legionella shakespearei DSM 23087 TaxID=1122169 RepID=A0A0W0ZC81_9GAMM|nr:bZIP transcription factor [Legionella shakespearei]KTD66398.1 hypothetical protein Lsha_0117 [Legionella shakespearei DSM 23087]